jgi:DNA-binding NarL/FixJ family response regulator
VVAARAHGNGAKTAPERLTPRLREVLQLVAEGHTTKEIARILKTSAKTVENHRARLMHRLGVNDVASLVRYAIQLGLIEARP